MTVANIDPTDFDAMEALLAANRAAQAQAGVEPLRTLLASPEWATVRERINGLATLGSDSDFKIQLQGMLAAIERVEQLPDLIESKI